MVKLTAKAIRCQNGFRILARERGACEWVELGIVDGLARARATILFLQDCVTR